VSIQVNLDRVIGIWQAKHGERMTYTRLAEEAGITLASLNRLKNGGLIFVDTRKVSAICDVLECELDDLLDLEQEHSHANYD